MPSVLLETFSYVVTVAYSARSGFPFTAWGETALIAVQDVVICALVFVLGQSAPTRRAMEKKKKEGGDAGGQQGKVLASVFVGVVAAGVYALQDTKVVDMGTLQTLQAGAGAVGVLSKAPQIWSNWQMGGTGQLSAFTVSISSSRPPSSPLHIPRTSTLACKSDTDHKLNLKTGIPLPCRLPLPHLHHPPGSPRPADPLRFHGRFPPKWGAGRADGVLLAQSRD